MKVHGDVKPTSLFTIEKMPKNKGFCLVRFFENAKAIDNGWEYNEYHLEIRDIENLADYVENNYSKLFEQAKANEPVDEIADLKDEVERLTDENTVLVEYLATLDEALIQMYEMMAE